MSRGIDLPETVPLFPLPGAVLMPRTRLPLQIFEPRYLQMVEDVLKTPSRLIGMIQPAEGGLDALAQVGCAGRIVAFSELDDGRLMISLKARSRFRLNEVRPGFTPYLRGQVDWSGYETDLAVQPEEDPRFERKGFMARLGRYMEQRGLSTDWDAAEASEEETLVNSLSMLLPFAPEEKQALLEAPTLFKRRILLEGLLEYALHGGDNEETIQ
ncbi:LON peptidase substrate-binding domain-containing protein [Paracoccus sp. PS-1]|uniref:LON peptidase substrate-binding domain-containing protein n=1 Tax=unclassified Paracoccus (in: a-proteobacteria) TaxID=2688777 RepID=UPI00048E4DE7|nr:MULTISPECIES: LON peptidase substrate-binding domain-containing protein [unclassified Paracoccus (in: a-proteobacteria)]MDQ7262995.1 LON peptidase substrate-binding domain-containing protein [Paracoccus sp. PS1]RQP06408.1 MAG: ATP-dependent protease [Paracoccus sp. BP8]UFM66025.1 LON peptidase substrate-binding domain-containing protein [Paracoccus sp. MA]